MSPDISVIILLFGWGESEKRSVESVLKQDIDRERMEIIAVTNNPDEQMAEYLKNNNIFSVYERAESVGSKVAVGVEKSSAPVVTFLEGGDLYSPDRVAQSADLINEDERNMYHHSSIIPIDDEGQTINGLHFNNIGYDLYTSQDDVPFAFPQVMRSNAARHVSAVTCRKSAIEKYLNLIFNVHQSADIALLAVCLQYGGRSMFDSSARTMCRINTFEGEDRLRKLLEQEKSFHLSRIEDMETLERTLKQQRALDIPRAEKIYSRIALSLISDDPAHRLGFTTMLHYFIIGLFEHYKEFRQWMWASWVGKLSAGYARRRFVGKLSQQSWNMRM